jgi:hypothetical protein
MSTSELTMKDSTYIFAIRWVCIISLFAVTEHSRQLIEAAARERFNDGAAQVLRAALKAIESDQKTLAEIRSGTFLSVVYSHSLIGWLPSLYHGCQHIHAPGR